MTREDYLASEPWEVFDLVELGHRKENENTKKDFYIARMQMSAMVDVSKLEFEWEFDDKRASENTESALAIKKKLLAISDAAHKKRMSKK